MSSNNAVSAEELSSSSFKTIEIANSEYIRDGLSFVTVKSKALQQRADLSLFVPETKEEKLPLIILLHGVYGSHWSWAFSGRAHITAQEMIDSGEIPPIALAMPSDGLFGDGSLYQKHSGKDFEQWICEEVPLATSEASAKITTDAPKAIAGLSMGGYGAMLLGAKHPELFKAISAHSSLIDLNMLQPFIEEELSSFLPDYQSELYSHLYWMKKNRATLPPLRFDCGLEDEFIESNRQLSQALKDENIPHQYQEFPGAHTWDYWTEHLRSTLKFLCAHLV